MNLTVQRRWLTPNSTIGDLSIAGFADFHLYTLEPVRLPDGSDVKPRAIGAGTFVLTIRFSPEHGRLIPHIEDVPGFTAVEMHIGNYPKDTKACTCVGKTRDVDFVGQSHAAFDQLFDILFAAAAENDGSAADEHKVYHVGYITFVDAGKAA